MKKKSILAGFIAGLFLIASALAFTTNEISAPTAYSTSATTTVNISGMVNISAFPYLDNFIREGLLNGTYANISRHVVNFTILNKSSSSGAYGQLASFAVNVTNDTSSKVNFWNYTATVTNDTSSKVNFWNYTATLKEGRNWIRINFTNISRADDGSFGGSLTSERIIDIDTLRYKLIIGGKGGFLKLNISTDTGLIQTDYGVQYGGSAQAACGTATRGLVKYNSTYGGFQGCTADGWKALNGTAA